jgi:hypothetical protein
VHAAAAYSVAHMNKDVSAADRAVSEIEADAEEAAQVLDHIHGADAAAVAFAKHARASAVTAADAADGALQGQRAAVAGGVRAVAAAHSAHAASQAAAEFAAAARAAGAVPPRFVFPGAAPAAGADEGDAAAALVDAKALVEAVVVLMQQLTNALEAAGSDCDKVDQILTYYQVRASPWGGAASTGSRRIGAFVAEQSRGRIGQGESLFSCQCSDDSRRGCLAPRLAHLTAPVSRPVLCPVSHPVSHPVLPSALFHRLPTRGGSSLPQAPR